MSTFEVLHRTSSPSQAHVELRVPAGCVYFDGHFAGNPMLPGVAQVALAEAEARRVFEALRGLRPVALQRLKFMATIRPLDEVDLTLALDGEALRFQLHRRAGGVRELASSGTLRFGGEVR